MVRIHTNITQLRSLAATPLNRYNKYYTFFMGREEKKDMLDIIQGYYHIEGIKNEEKLLELLISRDKVSANLAKEILVDQLNKSQIFKRIIPFLNDFREYCKINNIYCNCSLYVMYKLERIDILAD